jgi:hypothetical protein
MLLGGYSLHVFISSAIQTFYGIGVRFTKSESKLFRFDIKMRFISMMKF